LAVNLETPVGASQLSRVFFHPDCHRRLWNLTRSAVLSEVSSPESARGLDHAWSYHRWGIAPRPEDTLQDSWFDSIKI